MNKLLSGPHVWPAILQAARRRGRKCVSTAYVGPGALKRLGLSPGDSVHCALSIRNAKCGAVYPQDLIDLKKSGVRVFASESLHAKIYLFGSVAIVGSPNSSARSQQLDEAALLTSDSSVVQAVRAWFDERQSAEQASDRFLRECQRVYRPPQWFALTGGGTTKHKTQREPGTGRRSARDDIRCWVLNNVNEDVDYPEAHERAIGAVEDRAVASGAVRSAKNLVSLSWPLNTVPGRSIRKGDWVLSIVRRGMPQNRRYVVSPIERCLAVGRHTNARGFAFRILALEQGADVTVPFSRFVKAAGQAGLKGMKRRTTCIESAEQIRTLERLASSSAIRRLAGSRR